MSDTDLSAGAFVRLLDEREWNRSTSLHYWLSYTPIGEGRAIVGVPHLRRARAVHVDCLPNLPHLGSTP